MKKLMLPLAFAATLISAAFTTYNATNWKIADGYSIKFAGTDAEGVFSKLSGEITFDEKNLAASKFMTTIDVTSINMGNGMKNKHAKSEKWFDAKQFPAISFISTDFTKTAIGYNVKGKLNIHGVERLTIIPFVFDGNTFKGNFSINRMDFGVGTMDGMSKKVSNEIKLEILVPVTK